MSVQMYSALPQGMPSTDTRGAVMVFMGAKGGCGATMVSANVAAGQAKAARVCLLDLDLCKGDVAGYLDLRSGRSVNLLLDRIDVLDDVLLAGSIETHRSGLDVLAQPYDLTELHHVTADEVRKVVALVREHYDLVVIDAGSRVDVAALTASLLADEIVILSTPDVTALRDTQRLMGLLRRIGVEEDVVRLVINKRQAKGGIQDADIVEQLHTPVAATIRWGDIACCKSDTTGRLLVDCAPTAPVTRDIADLWMRLRGESPAPAARRTWWWTRS